MSLSRNLKRLCEQHGQAATLDQFKEQLAKEGAAFNMPEEVYR